MKDGLINNYLLVKECSWYLAACRVVNENGFECKIANSNWRKLRFSPSKAPDNSRLFGSPFADDKDTSENGKAKGKTKNVVEWTNKIK